MITFLFYQSLFLDLGVAKISWQNKLKLSSFLKKTAMSFAVLSIFLHRLKQSIDGRVNTFFWFGCVQLHVCWAAFFLDRCKATYKEATDEFNLHKTHDTDSKVGDLWGLPFTIRFFSSEACLTKLVYILRSGWSRSTRRGDSVFGSFFTWVQNQWPYPSLHPEVL